jgi:hypothetical protein
MNPKKEHHRDTEFTEKKSFMESPPSPPGAEGGRTQRFFLSVDSVSLW